MIWTCPECGRDHIQNGASDLYCVCGDGQVALESGGWTQIELVRREKVLGLIQDLRYICTDSDTGAVDALDSLKRKIRGKAGTTED